MDFQPFKEQRGHLVADNKKMLHYLFLKLLKYSCMLLRNYKCMTKDCGAFVKECKTLLILVDKPELFLILQDGADVAFSHFSLQGKGRQYHQCLLLQTCLVLAWPLFLFLLASFSAYPSPSLSALLPAVFFPAFSSVIAIPGQHHAPSHPCCFLAAGTANRLVFVG